MLYLDPFFNQYVFLIQSSNHKSLGLFHTLFVAKVQSMEHIEYYQHQLFKIYKAKFRIGIAALVRSAGS